MRFIFLILSVCIVAFGYIDSDFDGVDDSIDQCPNTPIVALVDQTGCTKELLVQPKTFDIIIGVDYTKSDYKTLNTTNTFSTTVQADYFYKNWTFGAISSYFFTSSDEYSNNALYDTTVYGSYQYNSLENFIVYVSGGIILPTYNTPWNNNNTDLFGSVSIKYTYQSFDVSLCSTYTYIADDDVVTDQIELSYQDSYSYTAGVGFYADAVTYLSTKYRYSTSIYKGVEPLQTLYLYGYHTFSSEYFATLLYGYGLSDSASDMSFSIAVGYLF